MMSETGVIYSIQRYCIHDGPGIRTNVFFKGCQLKCPWCANPESQKMQWDISFLAHKCTECGLCMEKCPEKALRPGKENRLDRSRCTFCGICVRYCPVECYQIFGREVTVEELVAEVEKDMPFYKNTGGGVTVTGGEPTLQAAFVWKFLKACKEKDMDTAMETHGIAPTKVFAELAPYVDHFLIDIKHMDENAHKRVVGVSNQKVLENIRMLTEKLGKEVSLRVPCIPEFNMDEENFSRISKFAEEIQKTEKLKMIHLLPYHNLGISKYDALNRDYMRRELPPVKDEELLPYKQKLEEAGLPVKIGG